MKINILVILMVLAVPLHGQDIISYDLDIKIDVKGRELRVNGLIEIDFQYQDSLKLVLWKKSNILKFEGMSGEAHYYFDTLTTPVPMLPDGGAFTIVRERKSPSKQTVNIEYISDMHNLDGWARTFSEEWIELNLYSFWFPVNLHIRNFTANVKIHIDKEYDVTGSGLVFRQDGFWEMKQPWTNFDIVVIATKGLKSKTLNQNNQLIQTDYWDFSDANADSINLECQYVLGLFQEHFGELDSAYFKYVIAPFDWGGGYFRKNFVSLRTKDYTFYTKTKGIAHEIAHFWWLNAPAMTSFEDWLNEGFAEYSMLLYIRERFGKEAFDKKREEFELSISDTPPVWGIDRGAPEAYKVLYEKGALILCDLEDKVGSEEFLNFLHQVSISKIRATIDLVALAERQLSSQTSQWLENEIRTR